VTELSILIPVLRRPQNAAPQVDSILRATNCDFEIVFITTAGDVAEHQAVDEQRARADVKVRHLTIAPKQIGDYAYKINFGYDMSESEWLFLAADDLNFHDGWWEAAILAAASTGCRVVGTQDMGNKRVLTGQHSTHSLVHRSYVTELGTIDAPGKVLHEGYPHEFVDDEFVETAKHRGEFVFANRSIVEHLHPLWGKGPTDALYDRHRVRMVQGRKVYTRRKQLWRSR